MSAISKRYAKALVELGAERQMVELFGAELAQVSAIFVAQAPLRLLMESPTFAPEKKGALLTDLAELLQVSTEMRNFLGLLLAKGRLSYLAEIEADFRRLADELSGVVRALVTAATSLEAGQHQAIRTSLERQTGKKVELKAQVDPSLIGGLQVEVGGRLFDGSLKTQLKRLEETLQKG